MSDEELDAVIERARQRAGPLGDEAVTVIIDEAIRAVRLRGALARTQSLTARFYEAWRADQFPPRLRADPPKSTR